MQLTLQKGPYSAVLDTMGGELVSFRDASGTEYIWGGDPAYWSGRNPVLFPIVGNLKDGKVRIDGQTCEMARHGFARRSEFSVAERGEDFAVLELRESPDTLARYPFPFVLRVRHQLLEGGFTTTFEVSNPGDGPMPFCVGAHTAFNCPLHGGERFEDYRLVFDQAEDADSLALTADGLLDPGRRVPMLHGTDTIPLSHEPFDRLDTLIFDGLRSKGVKLVHKDTGRGVHMAFEGFPMVAFWTMANANAPYICLEPWHGCAAWADESGEFADKPHCITLQPGERRALAYTVRTV
ncbi:MAG: aldose 1-epimerase family protein [Oscillospiraceae bacterium]|nr:aldose 1-epimerase family protein [Oscillospiraceae bacterium]